MRHMPSVETTRPNPARAAWPVVRRRTDWRGMAMVAAFSVLPVLGQFAVPMQTLDEALLLVYPEQVLAGRTPHSDFFTVYGPGGFGLLAAVYSVLGPSVIAERGVGLLYHLAIATGILQLTSPFGRIASRSAGVMSALLLVPLGLLPYAWLGGLALAVWSLALLARPSGPRSAFVAGVLGGLVPAWRIEMVILLAASGPLIWRTGRCKPYLTGLIVGLVPTALLLATSGRQVLHNIILSRMTVNAQLRLDAVPALVWAGVALSVLTTGALAVVASRRSLPQRLLMSYAAFAMLLLPQEMQRIDLPHMLFAVCVIAPLGVACLIALGNDRGSEPARGGLEPAQVGLLVLTIVLLALLTTSAANSLRNSNATELTHNGRSILVSPTKKAELAALLRAITETVPEGSSIFVWRLRHERAHSQPHGVVSPAAGVPGRLLLPRTTTGCRGEERIAAPRRRDPGGCSHPDRRAAAAEGIPLPLHGSRGRDREPGGRIAVLSSAQGLGHDCLPPVSHRLSASQGSALLRPRGPEQNVASLFDQDSPIATLKQGRRKPGI